MNNEQLAQHEDLIMTGTYSPEDNKLRITASDRLPPDLYTRLKEHGFTWAPKQGIFVAPMWTPQRADLVIELCGFIDDEQMTREERAVIRAERFEAYRVKREAEAVRELDHLERIDDGSGLVACSDNWRQQRKAQKKAEQIERAKERAIQLWDTSEYWDRRAAGVLSHADRMDDAGVRVRRIKTLTADYRRQMRYVTEAEGLIKLWTNPDKELTQERAEWIANCHDHFSTSFTLERFPRDFETYEGSQSLWGALDKGIITPEQARDLTLPSKHRTISWYTRWAEHTQMRINYETALLNAAGYVVPEKPKRPAPPPLLNYRQPEGFQMKPRGYSRDGSTKTWPQVEMTKAEYKKIGNDYKGTRPIDGHRVRIAMIRDPAGIADKWAYVGLVDVCVFLTDSKEHTKPEATA